MDPRQQRFNFAAFTRLRWPSKPAPDGYQLISLTAAGTAIESAFWLGLGAELAVYPEMETQRLLTLSKLLISSMQAHHQDRLSLVTPEIQRLELAELLQRGRADAYPDRVPPERGLVPYFHSLVHLSHRMSADSLGSTFRESLMFRTAREWSDVIESPVSVDVVNDFVTHRRVTPRPSLESMIAGFLYSVRDMTMMNDVLSSLEADASLSGSRSTLIRRAGRITCWRLDFSLDQGKVRYFEIAARAKAVIQEVSRVTQNAITLGRNAFDDVVQQAADRWDRFHPKFMTMTA